MVGNASRLHGSGFMLLEVVLSVLVIGTGLLLVIRSYSTSLGATRMAQGLREASLFLEEKLFELDVQGEIEQSESSGTIEGYEGYHWYVTAEPFTDEEEMQKVCVSAVYNDTNKRTRSVKIYTLLKNKEDSGI